MSHKVMGLQSCLQVDLYPNFQKLRLSLLSLVKWHAQSQFAHVKYHYQHSHTLFTDLFSVTLLLFFIDSCFFITIKQHKTRASGNFSTVQILCLMSLVPCSKATIFPPSTAPQFHHSLFKSFYAPPTQVPMLFHIIQYSRSINLYSKESSLPPTIVLQLLH